MVWTVRECEDALTRSLACDSFFSATTDAGAPASARIAECEPRLSWDIYRIAFYSIRNFGLEFPHDGRARALSRNGRAPFRHLRLSWPPPLPQHLEGAPCLKKFWSGIAFAAGS